mmetsp:Transcript_20461/g.57218  ORF Transcript_20461/g.57218 Transcript_20461/m.57218 type:complete len:275 (-) Transcript_20461:239-1063(-)
MRLRSGTAVVLVLSLSAAMLGRIRHLACVRPLGGACELIVVRHGETEWNRALRVQGSTDIELNAKGRIQADRCAAALAKQLALDSRPKVVLSSELGRAAVTAASIALALSEGAGASTTVRQDPRLNEWDLGVLEGLRKEEAAKEHPEDWRLFSEHWSVPRVSPEVAATRIAGGESMREVRARAVAALEEACREAQAEGMLVIAVTHGGVLGQLLQHTVEIGTVSADISTAPANACISRFLVTPDGRWEVTSWSEIDHLDGDAAPHTVNYNKVAS